jgi:DNA-binding NarL/FixJ family response regulator
MALATGAPRDAARRASGDDDELIARRPPQISVIIAHGHWLVRAGLRRLFEDHRDIAVDGEAANGEQVLALAERLRPEVIVVDVDLPGLDGFEATRRVLAQPGAEALGVVLLIDADSDEAVFAALEAGASAVLLRDSDAPELLHAVRVAAGGGAMLGPELTRTLVTRLLTHGPARGRMAAELSELTPREREVMGLVALGLSNDEIAERLVVTAATAKTHVSRARRKLGARDRAQLVVYAYETGLVAPRTGAPGRHDPVVAGERYGRWPAAAQHGLRRVS